MTGVTQRPRRDGSVVFEAQVARPRVDGRPQSPLCRRFPTLQQAQDWHRDTLAAQRAKREPTPAPVVHTLRSWTARWLPDSHLSPGAQAYAAGRLDAHVLPVIGDMALGKIKPTHLNRLYRDMRSVREGSVGKPLARATLVRIHGVLSQVLGAAAMDGLIDRNPATDVRLPRRTAPPREAGAWSPSQVAAFLAYEPAKASRLHPLFLAAFCTGLRRSEILGLIPEDVQLDAEPEPEVSVRRSLTDGGTKSDAAQRVVPLTPAAARVLGRLVADREHGPCQAPELFLDTRGRALSPTQVSNAFQRLVDRFVASPEGIAVRARRITLHGTRRSYVTNLLLDPKMTLATVSKLAGHSSVAITGSRYFKLSAEHARGAAGLYPELDEAA